MEDRAFIDRITHHTRATACLSCGKCTAACPLSLSGSAFSPRRLVEAAIQGNDVLLDLLLWECLACRACWGVCPSNVDYTGFVRLARQGAVERGATGRCTHGDALHAAMRLMANGARPERLGWLEATGLQTSPESDTVYFVGCLPFFAPTFEPMGAECNAIACATLGLLNALGIAPQVLADEVCCGHDLLWSGDEESFARLAERNVAALQTTGATRIVTACPECAYTLSVLYPQAGFDIKMEVLHLSQLLAGADWGGLEDEGQRVTFQDPCRLGRYLGEYDAPRAALSALGCKLVEMPHSRQMATCCGTSSWINCGAVNKRIQAERLREAARTGAEVLVTACPKCQVHFRCALDDPDLVDEIELEVRDLATLFAELIGAHQSETRQGA